MFGSVVSAYEDRLCRSIAPREALRPGPADRTHCLAVLGLLDYHRRRRRRQPSTQRNPPAVDHVDPRR